MIGSGVTSLVAGALASSLGANTTTPSNTGQPTSAPFGNTASTSALGLGLALATAGAGAGGGGGEGLNTQLAKMALAGGSSFVQSRVPGWFSWLNLAWLKPYFHVDNSYVLKKIGYVEHISICLSIYIYVCVTSARSTNPCHHYQSKYTTMLSP